MLKTTLNTLLGPRQIDLKAAELIILIKQSAPRDLIEGDAKNHYTLNHMLNKGYIRQAEESGSNVSSYEPTTEGLNFLEETLQETPGAVLKKAFKDSLPKLISVSFGALLGALGTLTVQALFFQGPKATPAASPSAHHQSTTPVKATAPAATSPTITTAPAVPTRPADTPTAAPSAPPPSQNTSATTAEAAGAPDANPPKQAD